MASYLTCDNSGMPAESTAARSGSASTAAQLRRATAASFVGTAIEWYDFFLFGLVTATVFDRLFFPRLDPTAGTLASFAAFAVAFIARPLGGVLFGHIGDRIGRKATLILTLLIMAVGTSVIGLLPTYSAIGIWAPALLLIARLVQGLSAGGELGGAILIAVEPAPAKRRGYYGSWPTQGVNAGLALASAAYLSVVHLTGNSLLSWGWRIPFLASTVLLLVGLYVRLRVLETPEFHKIRKSGQRAGVPIAVILRHHKRALLIGMGALTAATIPFYIATLFTLSYGPKQLGMSPQMILAGTVVAALVAVPLIPLLGALSDRLGRIRVLKAGAVYMALIAFPFFWLFETGEPVLIGLALLLVLAVGTAVTFSVLTSFLAELFDAPVRYSGIALSYQLNAVLTSGPAPFVAAGLYAWANSSWPVAVYMIAGSLVALVALVAAGRGPAGPGEHR
ncbi:metabolite-proton symporter [Micromonospora inyonensis]|uniref:Putative proline/betaine transporter n=2 Tax=Micromonospora inyonensis TaxID=47866 RepID=A0A1C6S601_9ACTN|nr:metabolite-proton symporter [Micromonospora inyonensis]